MRATQGEVEQGSTRGDLPTRGSIESMSDSDVRSPASAHADRPEGRPVARRIVTGVGALAVVSTTLFFAGAGHSPSKATPAVAATRPVPEVRAEFPYKTASDIVSYADHVALVTAVSEREAPPPAAPEIGAPSDTISRRVTFRVDDVLWSRAGAPVAPTKFTALWWGWLANGRQPVVVDGAPWVFVGGRYLVPIAFDGKGFSPIQPFAVFRFDRGAVRLEDQDTALARSLSGASRKAIAAIFAAAVPDPLAVRFADLLPGDRLNAVIAAQKP